MYCRMPYSFRSQPPTRDGSGASMCPTAPDLTSLLRNALALPRVPCSRVFKACSCISMVLARHVGRWHHHDLQDVWAGSLQDVQTGSFRATLALMTTRKMLLQCKAAQQDGATLLTRCDVVGRQASCTLLVLIKHQFHVPTYQVNV
jgi:hypothetical protein